jgi:hypothetical protein
VLAQLVEDLVHLERRRVGLDEHGRPDRAARDVEERLGQLERVVPEPRLEVRLHLRQVEVRTLAAVDLLLPARNEVEREVDQAAGRLLAVDEQVLLRQVPATRAYDDRRELDVVAELVLLALRAGEVEVPGDRVEQVELTTDDVLPQRGVRVLVVGEPDLRARVERVDRHLAIGRAGDLDAPVDQAGRRIGHPPRVVLADRAGLLEEVQGAARGQLRDPLTAPGQQLRAAGTELAVQQRDQLQGGCGEDLVVPVVHRSGDLDTLGQIHRSPRSIQLSGTLRPRPVR